MLQSWQKSDFHQIEQDLQIHNSGEIQTSLICYNIYFYMKIKICYQCLIKFKYNIKRLFSIKSDMSNFTEFRRDYKCASHVLFYLSWIFADFI